MDFEHSGKVRDLQARLTRFMEENVYPAEAPFAAEVLANRQRRQRVDSDAGHGAR